jgi:hypothetical protein
MRSNFNFWHVPEKNIFCIVDLYNDMNPTITVTNDAENVINSVIKALPKGFNDMTRFFYQDSDGQIDQIIPTFNESGRCIDVAFKYGGVEDFNDII